MDGKYIGSTRANRRRNFMNAFDTLKYLIYRKVMLYFLCNRMSQVLFMMMAHSPIDYVAARGLPCFALGVAGNPLLY
jgi:hypothetical protein